MLIDVTETSTSTVTATQRPTETAVPSSTNTPTQTRIPTRTPTLTLTPIIPDSGWETLRPGLERRVINIIDELGVIAEHLYILRIESEHFRFDVGYHPQPLSLEDWYAETGALVIANGGYFRAEGERYFPTGLAIINGEPIGSSYGDFAGMLAITAAGPELRWLAVDPYFPGEPIRAGLQCFPILVKPGGLLGFPAQAEDHRDARRTVIGQDFEGRILLIVASRGYFTLHRLSLYLTESDLDLDFAFNLDGGPSSGILVTDPWEEVPAQSLLPIVITVHE